MHGARTGEVQFGAEPGAVVIVVAVAYALAAVAQPHHVALCRQRRSTDPGRVGHGLPRVVLVPAQIFPAGEVGVVVLATGLEQVRMVAHQHAGDALDAHVEGDRVLPQLDRAPRLPQEVQRTAQDVVARRHARQRAHAVVGELHRAGGKPVEVGRVELAAAIRSQHVAVEAVQQYHHGVGRLAGLVHGAPSLPWGGLIVPRPPATPAPPMAASCCAPVRSTASSSAPEASVLAAVSPDCA